MNRRSFIQSLLVGVVAPAFLPGENRQWKRVESLLIPEAPKIIPFWIQTIRAASYCSPEYLEAMNEIGKTNPDYRSFL